MGLEALLPDDRGPRRRPPHRAVQRDSRERRCPSRHDPPEGRLEPRRYLDAAIPGGLRPGYAPQARRREPPRSGPSRSKTGISATPKHFLGGAATAEQERRGDEQVKRGRAPPGAEPPPRLQPPLVDGCPKPEAPPSPEPPPAVAEPEPAPVPAPLDSVVPSATRASAGRCAAARARGPRTPLLEPRGGAAANSVVKLLGSPVPPPDEDEEPAGAPPSQ